MCSVVGYVGYRMSRALVMQGLKRLEYRGYDSAGFSCLSSTTNTIACVKSAGMLSILAARLDTNPVDGYIGIGHTRWSTHGVATEKNAHPHVDCHKTLSLVHNGIIENSYALRGELLNAGHTFISDTDTEVAAHVLEDLCKKNNSLKDTIVEFTNRLEGSYAFMIILQAYPDMVLLIRKKSPLCVGFGNGEAFVASDTMAFAEQVQRVIFLPDESFAFVRKDSIELYSFNGLPLVVQESLGLSVWHDIDKNEHEHYMLKEIYEQKKVISETVNSLHAMSTYDLWNQMGMSGDTVRNLDKLRFVGCGTSWHAARIAQFFFETIALVPTQVLLASEFRYMPFFPTPKTLHVIISQSGETADALEALRLINDIKLPTLILTNTPSSTMVREANGFFATQAGIEIAVASTKAFSTQLAALYWFAHHIAYQKGIISAQDVDNAVSDVQYAAHVLEQTIDINTFAVVTSLAKKYAHYNRAIFLGRHISYPFALEAALKLKEISYIFSQCYPAGELKHGPLALIDEHIPVFICSHLDPLIYQKLVANVQEVKARGGRVFAFAFEGQEELCQLADDYVVIPKVNTLLGPLAMTGIMQYFFYAIAKELGRPIDRPRNLAKSVTVE